MCILAKVLNAMIDNGNIEGLREKIDIFYAADRLTLEEYEYLVGLLPPVDDDVREHG